MYTIETLPLALDLDQSKYIQSADIELIDAAGFVQKNLFVSSAVLPFDLSVSRANKVGFSNFVPVPLAAVNASSFDGAVAKEGLCALPWGELTSIDKTQVLFICRASNQLENGFKFSWNELQHVDRASSLQVESVSVNINSGWDVRINDTLFELSRVIDAPQFAVDLYTIRDSEYDLRQKDLFTDLSAVLRFDESPYIPDSDIGWGNYRLTKLPATPLSTTAQTSAYQPPAKEDLIVLPWGEGIPLQYSPELPYAVEEEIIVPGEVPNANKREVYLIVNNVNIKSLPGNEPLDVADIKIDLDEDAYSWKFSAIVLNQQSVDLMKPDVSGYKEVEVSINGHVWVFFITTWQRSQSVSGKKLDKKYQVSGYSRTQYLGQPYAPKRTKSIGSTTAVQAAITELTGTGFTINWDVSRLQDWQMLDSAFSYQELTPLQVIKRLASAVGAVVLPAMASDELTVVPRHRIAPWDLSVANIDRTIHENQVLSEGGTLLPQQKINAVRVSGERHGVDMNITRQGTAGDMPGADVVDAWLSAAEANTSRGRAEIADSGNVEVNTLELAIPESAAQPGLLLPGLYVAVQHMNSAKDYKGRVSSVSISVPGRGLAKVRQNVVVRRSVAWEVVA